MYIYINWPFTLAYVKVKVCISHNSKVSWSLYFLNHTEDTKYIHINIINLTKYK